MEQNSNPVGLRALTTRFFHIGLALSLMLVLAAPLLQQMPAKLMTIQRDFLANYESGQEALEHVGRIGLQALVLPQVTIGLLCLLGMKVAGQEWFTSKIALLPRRIATTLTFVIAVPLALMMKLAVSTPASAIDLVGLLAGVAIAMVMLMLLVSFALDGAIWSAPLAANPVVHLIGLSVAPVAAGLLFVPAESNFALCIVVCALPFLLIPVGKAYAAATAHLRDDAAETSRRIERDDEI